MATTILRLNGLYITWHNAKEKEEIIEYLKDIGYTYYPTVNPDPNYNWFYIKVNGNTFSIPDWKLPPKGKHSIVQWVRIKEALNGNDRWETT